jgi:pyruvate,water dikinase
MWIRALADADASCGAKAAGLARLIAAGLPVPEGFVLERAAFSQVAALTEVSPDAIGHVLAEAEQRIAGAARTGKARGDVVREVQECAAALGRLAVRSSASIEDGALGSAAGVFASVTDVSPADVWDAVCAVWTSALTPLAVAYARRRATAVAIAVILQRFIAGQRVTVYTRPIGAPDGDEIWLSRGAPQGIERIARASTAAHPEAAIALAAEAAIDASQGADVELVLEATPGGVRPWVVQARPMIHPVRQVRSPPPPIVLAPLVADGRRWTWDIAHNPDPLSPAQTGLVDHVERAAVGPYAMKVCGGYLYATPRAHQTVPAPPMNRAELTSRIAAIEARFVLGQAPTLEIAVERYVGFMKIWAGELSPLVAAARRCLPDRLVREGTPASEVAMRVAALVGPRRVLRDRVMSPAWDVAVPAFAERPEPASASDLREPRRIAAPVVPRELVDDVDLARAAADAGEQDDLWFARAQWMVRQALLARGAKLQLRDDDVFWLPLDELLRGPRGALENPDDAHRRASAARAASARAADWDMPLVVHAHGGEPAGAEPRVMLRGVGEGPRIVGRVVRFGSLGEARRAGRGDVVVTRAITPALAMLVDGCAALVSETGGLLDHGAALARELGIPCVVGCTHAWAQLTDGAVIFVDGDAGLVGLVSPAG